MFDIDCQRESYTANELAKYLRALGTPDDVRELVRELTADAQRQSGMESKHERWVLETLNFLMGQDIPVYNYDSRGARLYGDKEIPERLKLVTQKIAAYASTAKANEEKFHSEKTLRKKAEACFQAIDAELQCADHSASRMVQVISEIVDHSRQGLGAPPYKANRDDRGVTHYQIDAREVVLRLGMSAITHDCSEDEKICPECLGLGILKCDQPYGTGERKPREDAFSYHHQWLAPCHVCYFGRVNLCTHCKEILSPRGHLWCKCPAAEAERAAEKLTKETERRTRCKRVSLADYDGKMVWADNADRFLMVDAVEDHLEDYPDEVFFGCLPTEPIMIPDAEDVIENLQNSATQEASPEDGDDVLDFDQGAEAALAEALTEWAQKYVSARMMWYADMDVIVEVPRSEENPSDLRDLLEPPP